ncbi:MAG: RNA polymerase sigma factor [Clostridia bacterium]|nr:RNA polymerase sigma factor [Clostridia bacterium]
MTNEETDKELYNQYLKGNKEAFEKLVIKHKNNIIYFISRYTKNTQIAEDISQDVFVYLLVNKNQYDFQYSFKTYLYMIAKCRAINYLKREKRIININDYENMYIEDNNLEEEIFKEEDSQNVRKVIKQLKPDYQAVIYLTSFEGLKYKEVAKIMNKNINQIKVLVNRAKKKMKILLEEEGFSYENR